MGFVSEPFAELVSDFLPTTFITAYYKAWCEIEGVLPFSKREFEIRLPDHIKDEWIKATKRPHTAGFNRAIDLHRAEELGKFWQYFYWDDEKQKQPTKGYLRANKKPKK